MTEEKSEYKYKCIHCSAEITTTVPYWMVNQPPELHLYCSNCDRKTIFRPSDIKMGKKRFELKRTDIGAYVFDNKNNSIMSFDIMIEILNKLQKEVDNILNDGRDVKNDRREK